MLYLGVLVSASVGVFICAAVGQAREGFQDFADSLYRMGTRFKFRSVVSLLVVGCGVVGFGVGKFSAS